MTASRASDKAAVFPSDKLRKIRAHDAEKTQLLDSQEHGYERTGMNQQGGKGEKSIEYTVNGELQTTSERKLSVKTILEKAGFTPASEYDLTRDNGDHLFQDQDEEVPLHKGESFTATFRGPTPTS